MADSFLRRAGRPVARLLLPDSDWGREARWRRLRSLADKAREQKNVFAAEQQLLAALKVTENFGDRDARHAEALHDLADFYEAVGAYTQAEDLYRQTLESKRRIFGDEHLETARSINDLALLHYTQGKYAEAHMLFGNLLPSLERLLGENHREVAVCLENSAAVLRKLRREAEADRLRARAKDIRLQWRSGQSGDQRPGETSKSP